MKTVSRLAALVAVLLVTSCGDSNPVAPRIEDVTFHPSLGVDLSRMERRASGLYIETLAVGTGTPAGRGSTVLAWYTGWLIDGSQFDSNLSNEEPYSFTLIAGGIIDGFGEGMRGMQPGGKRRLVIPPSLGYGSTKTGDIPANSILVFEIEVVEVR